MLIFFLTLMVILAGLYGWYRLWLRKVEAEIAEGAEFEFERLSRADPDLLKGLDQPAFAAIFRRVELPRFPGYALAIAATFMIGTPVILALLSAGDWAMNQTGMVPQPDAVVTELLLDEDGTAKLVNDVPPEALQYYVEDLGGFYYFFGMLGFWVLIVWVYMKRYHSRSPGTLRDEILRAR